MYILRSQSVTAQERYIQFIFAVQARTIIDNPRSKIVNVRKRILRSQSETAQERYIQFIFAVQWQF